jgi:hypothetical protein
MSNVIKAGSSTGAVVVGGHTTCVKVMPTGGAATVSFNGQTVTLPTTMVAYLDIYGDYPRFTVLSGTVLYIAFG